MKKQLHWLIAAIFVVSPLLTSCSNDDKPESTPEYATLKEALASIDRITDIKSDPDATIVKKKQRGELDYKEAYSMFFRQDVNHDVAGGNTFQQKVCIVFRGFDRPTILVTEGYMWYDFHDAEDLSVNLNANLVHVEHRNFGESYNRDNGVWEYETAAQTSADLHAVFQALKPLFKGKWMSTGNSKNGVTSIHYAYYYPNDMDLTAAFCAPFMLSLADARFGDYLQNEISTEQNRKLMKQGIRKALNGGEDGIIFKSVCRMFESSGMKTPAFTEYVSVVFDSFFQIFQYSLDNEKAEKLTTLANDTEALVQQIASGIQEGSDEEYYTYYVDCILQLGCADPGYSYYADLLDNTGFDKDKVILSFLKDEDHPLMSRYDSSLNNEVLNTFLPNTDHPVLMYYAKDDPWSAGRPTRLSPSVKLVINPVGIHKPSINDPALCPAEIKQEVMDFVGKYIY